MILKSKLIYLTLFFSIGIIQQENHPPVVKIVSPKANGVFDAGAQVNYSISVSDKEDGESKYDEINGKEVLLEVKYIKDKSKLSAILNKPGQTDAPGIAVMRTSNCFNCHNFNSKAIGPSFYEISKRYPPTKSNTDSLVKHILEGYSDTWGKEKMPSHPELTKEEIKTTVLWILKHAADPDVNYYIGLDGTFHINPPVTPTRKGVYLLTASYIDCGLKSSPGKERLRGQDVVVVYGK